MGLLGTDIASNFAQRIFDTFSYDGQVMKLDDYLKYVDVYHHGNEKERCLITYRLMDYNKTNGVDKTGFENYINLIIAAIKKVHPGAEDNLLSSKEIEMLFNKISNNKPVFTYQDFEHVYFNKPQLLSWIDYFKNNDHEILGFLNINIKSLMIIFERFNSNMIKILDSITQLNGQTFNFNSAIKEIERYCKIIEFKKNEFIQNSSTFNIRSIFDDLSNTINIQSINKILIKR